MPRRNQLKPLTTTLPVSVPRLSALIWMSPVPNLVNPVALMVPLMTLTLAVFWVKRTSSPVVARFELMVTSAVLPLTIKPPLVRFNVKGPVMLPEVRRAYALEFPVSVTAAVSAISVVSVLVVMVLVL